MEVFSPLVGVTFRGADAKDIVRSLTQDDGDKLQLQADPFNEYDSRAVKVIHVPTGEHLGFVARDNNFEVFEALTNGAELEIKIISFENTLKPTMLIREKESNVLEFPSEDE